MGKPTEPKGLRAGGKALWKALATDGMAEPHVALLTEAARVRDRLDQLDRILTGDVDTWCDIATDYLGEPIKLNIAPALANANATASNLRALLDKIPVPATKQAGGIRDQLAARRASREAGAESPSAPEVRQRGRRTRRD